MASIRKEIFLQKEYLGGSRISTVYFGGGTPSLLSKGQILDIFGALTEYFPIDKDAEVTLEANPDDLSKEKLKALAETPVNRLSIGIQSFREEDLKLMNRAHNSQQAVDCVINAQKAGFQNITIDLIYGLQTLANDQWRENIRKAMDLKVQHISCYSLTVEPRTALASFIKAGKVLPADTEKSAAQFEILMEEMRNNNFLHYEISNFCKEGFYSKHNSNYWKGEKYLGFGPSAHSFDGISRQWNVKSNSAYISAIQTEELPFEKEELTEAQRYNEYVLTTLRTIWGTDLAFLRQAFSENMLFHFLKEMKPFLDQKKLIRDKERVFLTDKGKLFADKIASDLFYVS